MSKARQVDKFEKLSLGVIVERRPGVTRWKKWAWKAVSVLPFAEPGNWREIRREGDCVTYHAATVDMELHRTETEAYLVSLNGKPPSVFVILRPPAGEDDTPEVIKVTASAYEAQDFTDNGEDIVEPVPMPEGLEARITEFVSRHHQQEEFVKRKRRSHFDEKPADGIGDARIRQQADVYRSPASIKQGQS